MSMLSMAVRNSMLGTKGARMRMLNTGSLVKIRRPYFGSSGATGDLL
jgi:hypothetical protein